MDSGKTLSRKAGCIFQIAFRMSLVTTNRMEGDGFSGGASGEERLPVQGVRDKDPQSILALGRPSWRRALQSTLGLLPGESCGQRSLVGYSPWGHKEPDMIEVT